MTDQDVSQQRTGQPYDENGRGGITNGIKRRLTSPSWVARAASVGLSSVSIGFVVLFMFVLETGGELTLFTRPLPMQIALELPYLVGILTLGATAGALLAWWHRYWSLAVRIHQSILAVLGLAFCWQLWTLGFLAL